MRKFLRRGSTRFEILDRHDTLLQFKDIASALELLNAFKKDPVQMEILRGVLAPRVTGISRMDDDAVIKRFAQLLVSGDIRILRSPIFGAGGGQVEEQEEQGQGGTQQGRTGGWIEINLRDMEGQPVPGKKYRIKLPDGVVEEGTLDEFGHAERYGIMEGTCQVSFPEFDAEAWERI
jgi:hypothetical protein